MRGVLEHLHQFAERDVLLHGDDVGARHHDVVDPALAQRQDVLEHGALFRRDAGLAGHRGFQHDFDVGAGRAGLPAEQRAREADKESFAIGSDRWRHRHRKIALLAGRAGDLGGLIVGVRHDAPHSAASRGA